MNRRILILALFTFLTVQTSFGQTKHISVPTYKNGEYSLWFKWQQEKFIKTGLSDLTKSKDSLHFRFSTETQAIDIWTADFNTYFGSLANFTTSYDQDQYKKENPKPDKFYSNKTELDTSTARQIYNLFSVMQVFKIPTDDSISGWTKGNDGEEFIIEYSTLTEYAFKEYWTPSAFKDEIKEAAIIDTTANQLQTTLQLQKSFGTFINSLPVGCYHSGSFFVTCTSKKKHKKNGKKGSR